MYLEIQDAILICRGCGISSPAFKKWLKCYSAFSEECLSEISSKSHIYTHL